eukprot:COSAG03_NODE_468_length_7665_cov_6.302670_2_plen_75_part_00
MTLQDRFLEGLKSKERQRDSETGTETEGAKSASLPGIRLDTLHSLLPQEHRSHTLVFDQPRAAAAKAVVPDLLE